MAGFLGSGEAICEMTCARSVIALLAAAVLAVPAYACIDTIDEQLLEKVLIGDSAALQSLAAQAEKAHTTEATLESGNDLAVIQILQGKYPQAIALLRETDAKFPGNARVAANLGTALEHSGNDVEALEWIRKGMDRDAGLHAGSEWLHARIIEAKIALAKDPKWLAANHVLALDFGKADLPVVPEILPITKEGRLRGGDDLVEDIVYQLDRHRKFVKPPSPVIGDLAASLGDLLYAGFDADPREHYELALTYGAPHADLIRARIKRYAADHPKPVKYEKPAPNAAPSGQEEPAKEKRPEIRPSSLIRIVWPVAALTLLLGVGGWFLRKRRRAAEAVERAQATERALAARLQGAANQDTRTISS
jgi:tetratricopeptide (TPR) repeat protein